MSQERPIRLHAGPWSLDFERWSGWVRCVRLSNQEIIRAVYAVARMEDWGTCSQRVVHSQISQENGQFEASWRIELDDLAFTWEGRVSSDGNLLELEWVGESGQEFSTRRTGMCVLHPQEIEGIPCKVEHSDGSFGSGQFPTLVEPHQPFKDIRSISHMADSAQLHIEFRGEVFEMEDQRNWTDASFKTYCRPQEWLQPYTVGTEERIQHSLRLSFDGSAEILEPSCRTQLHRSDLTVALPRIGTVAQSPQPGFDFVLNLNEPNPWASAGFGRIHTAGSFVELNRNRPDTADLDGVAFGATPQVHVFDERSIMENVIGLSGPVLTAKAFASNRAVCVGPIQFRPSHLGSDGRLDRDIGPAWLLASVVVLAKAGADAACFLEYGDFRGRLKEALNVVAGAKEITLYDSDNPYRAMAFRVNETDVIINMRSYATSVYLKEDLELEPYEIRVLG